MADRMETMPVADSYETVDYDKNIVLECSDEVACVLPKKLASFCSELAKLIKEDKSEVQVPLSEIKSDTINRIFIFLKHHENSWPPQPIERPLKNPLRDTMLGQWDYDTYLQTVLLSGGDITQNDNVFLVLKAAHSLDCKPLMAFTCAAVADIVRGVKNEQDFYKLFNVKEPFTQAETEKLYEVYEYQEKEQLGN